MRRIAVLIFQHILLFQGSSSLLLLQNGTFTLKAKWERSFLAAACCRTRGYCDSKGWSNRKTIGSWRQSDRHKRLVPPAGRFPLLATVVTGGRCRICQAKERP